VSKLYKGTPKGYRRYGYGSGDLKKRRDHTDNGTDDPCNGSAAAFKITVDAVHIFSPLMTAYVYSCRRVRVITHRTKVP
jgi:hypothetical protein